VSQAIQFDVEQTYKSRLEVALRRLQLRSQPYTKPKRSEDTAAVIIEQVMHCSYLSLQTDFAGFLAIYQFCFTFFSILNSFFGCLVKLGCQRLSSCYDHTYLIALFFSL